MMSDEHHPDVSRSDWEAFRNSFSPALFEEVIDRTEGMLPDHFVPLARGIAIPSDALLRKACVGVKDRPTSWRWRKGKLGRFQPADEL